MKIHQMLPNYSYGDAIGNHTTEIQKLLRGWGYESEIYANETHKKLTAKHYLDYLKDVTPDTWVIYHYSTGSKVNQFVLDNVDNLILMYHNITPGHFFEGFDDAVAQKCHDARKALCKFAEKTSLAIGVSEYNVEELKSFGFSKVKLAPLILNFEKISPAGKNPFKDDKTNILFVGRVAPNKRHEDLIKVFYFYRNYVDKDSRLVLVGGYDENGAYYKSLKRLAEVMDLPEVVFTGNVSDEELGDYYASASVFLCLSRHEGFCVPLLEAMRFRIPIVAYSSTGVRATMGRSGSLITGMEPQSVAELIGLIREDRALRGKIIESQLHRMEDFGHEKSVEMFHKAVIGVLDGAMV